MIYIVQQFLERNCLFTTMRVVTNNGVGNPQVFSTSSWNIRSSESLIQPTTECQIKQIPEEKILISNCNARSIRKNTIICSILMQLMWKKNWTGTSIRLLSNINLESNSSHFYCYFPVLSDLPWVQVFPDL